MKYTLFIFILLISLSSSASNEIVLDIKKRNEINVVSNFKIDTNSTPSLFKTKVTAISLALTLGVFGVHRLYLGTKPLVPIAYTLTLGGGMFILPLIDIIFILSVKDIERLKNNNFVFMWNKKSAKTKVL